MTYNSRYKRIAIKVGSNVLTKKDGRLDVARIAHLVDQISYLKQNNVEVLLISSGAVAAGRDEITPNKKLNPVAQRQLCSAVGQVKLINRYSYLFRDYDITTAQVLATKDDFKDRQHYLNMYNCLNVMLENQVLPIINENDTISVSELMFTDNDELSGLIASMMNCEALLILSNIDGVYTTLPSLPNSKLLTTIEANQDLSAYIQKERSSLGRGGMTSKCSIAQKLAQQGINVHIANGSRTNILINLNNSNQTIEHTHIKANPNTISPIKRWLAHSASFTHGALHINHGAQQALCSPHANSLLSVGIQRIEGTFSKGDLVKIYNPQGVELGVGKIRYNSQKTNQYLNRSKGKVIIHYDYLLLTEPNANN